MSRTLNVILRTTLVFMIIGATLNVVGEILLARGGPFPESSALWASGFRGALVGGAVGAFVGSVIALILGAFKKYTSSNNKA
jgi:Na+-driven multidrug efflux pump